MLNHELEGRDVRGIILQIDNDKELYLRFEGMDGGFIIEVFNPNCPFFDLSPLAKLLEPFHYCTGYMETVIPSQMNFVFISKNKSRSPICFPVVYRAIALFKVQCNDK
jgi:hypothetical protein